MLARIKTIIICNFRNSVYHMSRLVTNLLRITSVSPSPAWLGGAKQFTSTATNSPPNRNKNDKSLVTAADADNMLSYVSRIYFSCLYFKSLNFAGVIRECK